MFIQLTFPNEPNELLYKLLRRGRPKKIIKKQIKRRRKTLKTKRQKNRKIIRKTI